jgi:hypothetical protein
MFDLLFWLYFINAILLICHEIESAYWEEWKLFKLPGGITGFVLLHIPLLALILTGLLLVFQMNLYGVILSILVALGGIFAFTIHGHFRKKGAAGFNLPLSHYLLRLILIISLAQLAVSVYILMLF